MLNCGFFSLQFRKLDTHPVDSDHRGSSSRRLPSVFLSHVAFVLNFDESFRVTQHGSRQVVSWRGNQYTTGETQRKNRRVYILTAKPSPIQGALVAWPPMGRHCSQYVTRRLSRTWLAFRFTLVVDCLRCLGCLKSQSTRESPAPSFPESTNPVSSGMGRGHYWIRCRTSGGSRVGGGGSRLVVSSSAM